MEINMNIPTYENDCECLNVCKSLGCTYDMCYKGENSMFDKRCSIETRKLLLQKHTHEESLKQERNERRKADKILFFISIAGLVISAITFILQ